MKGGRVLLTLVALGLSGLALAGPEPIGRLALMAGWPSLAARLITEPGARGVALFRAGDFAGADAAFKAAGRTATFNRGTSLAMLGNYPLARAYFDAVLFANPADSRARENRNLVNARIPVIEGEGNAAGRIAVRAIATSGGSPIDEVKRLGRPLEEGRRVADDAWLQGLPDDQGAFLRLRLASEHARRMSMGLTPPEAGDPW